MPSQKVVRERSRFPVFWVLAILVLVAWGCQGLTTKGATGYWGAGGLIFVLTETYQSTTSNKKCILAYILVVLLWLPLFFFDHMGLAEAKRYYCLTIFALSILKLIHYIGTGGLEFFNEDNRHYSTPEN